MTRTNREEYTIFLLGSKAYDTVTFFPVLSSSLICQSSISLVFFQGSAALWLLFGWAGQCSLRAAFRQCSAVFSAFLGAHRPSTSRWVCVTSSRELRSTCFIYFFKNVSFSVEETATQRRLRACDPFISSVYFLVS